MSSDSNPSTPSRPRVPSVQLSGPDSLYLDTGTCVDASYRPKFYAVRTDASKKAREIQHLGPRIRVEIPTKKGNGVVEAQLVISLDDTGTPRLALQTVEPVNVEEFLRG